MFASTPAFILPFPTFQRTPASSIVSSSQLVASLSPATSQQSSFQQVPSQSSLSQLSHSLPLQSRLLSQIQPPIPTNFHPMITRSKASIFKPKVLSATKHPIDIDTFMLTTYLQTSKHAH